MDYPSGGRWRLQRVQYVRHTRLASRRASRRSHPDHGRRSASRRARYDACYPSNERTNELTLPEVRARLREGHVTLTKPSDALHTHPALHVPPASARARSAKLEDERRAFSTLRLGQLNDYACGGEGAMRKWLDDAQVQAALHVNSSGGGMRYQTTAGDLRAVYEKLVQKYPILIYRRDWTPARPARAPRARAALTPLAALSLLAALIAPPTVAPGVRPA